MTDFSGFVQLNKMCRAYLVVLVLAGLCQGIAIQNMRPPTSYALESVQPAPEEGYADESSYDMEPDTIDQDLTRLASNILISRADSPTVINMPFGVQEAEFTINSVINILINDMMNLPAGPVFDPPEMVIELAREYSDAAMNPLEEVSVEVGLAVIVAEGTVRVNGLLVPWGDIYRMAIPITLVGRSVVSGQVVMSQPTMADIVVQAAMVSASQVVVEVVIGAVSDRRLPTLRLQQALIDIDDGGNEVGREIKVIEAGQQQAPSNPSAQLEYAFMLVLNNIALDSVMMGIDLSSSPAAAPTPAATDDASTSPCTDEHRHRDHLRKGLRLVLATLMVLLLCLAVGATVRCVRHCRHSKASRIVDHNIKLQYESTLPTLADKSSKSAYLLI